MNQRPRNLQQRKLSRKFDSAVIGHDRVVDRILCQLVGFQLLVGTWPRVEVCEIPGHVVHGKEHRIRVAKDAKRALGRAGPSGRAQPHFIVELEVADAQELLGVLRAIRNRLLQLAVDDIQIVGLGTIMAKLCEEQRLLELGIRLLHIALA